MGKVGFFISEAFRALRRSAAPSMAAIVTIVVTTLLLGVLVPVLKASEDKAQDVRDQIGLNVYLYDDATPAEIDALGKELGAIEHVQVCDQRAHQRSGLFGGRHHAKSIEHIGGRKRHLGTISYQLVNAL